MAIKLDHLKREVLRRKIAVTVNGDVDFIEIYNPTGEDRANLLAFLDSKVNTNNIDDSFIWNTINTNNIININSIDNIGKSTSCGSGKKYKQCCGK